ncbi:hypothetical protein BK011_07875 [Tenericutes bacterium MZ-XQ]|nr:hypothetical protein BK011_07875 [Tenericutes bacterium MZ-XQ]
MKKTSKSLIKNYYNDGILDLYYFLFCFFFMTNVSLSRMGLSDFIAPLISISVSVIIYKMINQLSKKFSDQIKGIAVFKKSSFRLNEIISFLVIILPVITSTLIILIREDVLTGENFIMLIVFSVVLVTISLLLTLRFKQFRFLYYALIISLSFVIGKWIDTSKELNYVTPILLIFATLIILFISGLVVYKFLQRNSLTISGLTSDE